MGAILLPIVGMMITLTLIIMFFFKKNIINDETKIYSKLILNNLMFLSVGIITYIIAKTTGNLKLIGIFQKIYLSILLILNYLSIKYCLKVFKIKFFNSKKKSILLFGITQIFIFLILIAPLHVIYDGNILDGEGPAYNIAIVYIMLSFVAILCITFYQLFKRKKESLIKLSPFLILIILYIIGFFIRQIYKELIFEGFFYSYILLLMYHTIENPDAKLLNEYIKNRKLAEDNIDDKTNILFRISQDVKIPAKKIEILSNQIKNSNNLTEIKNNNKQINYLSTGITDTINNVLDISNMDLKNIKQFDVLYDTNNLFNQIILSSKEKCNGKIDFKYSISSLVPKKLYGDSLKIKQIIYSIIANSIATTEEGTIDLDVTSIVKYDICKLIITISDTGKSMPLNEINNLLENNYNIMSDKEIEKVKDLEVSLKLVKKIIDILGGNLLIRSEDKKGKTFTVILNQKINSEDDTKESVKNFSNILNNKKKILLLDDDYQELTLIEKELKLNNYDVVSSMYYQDCLDKLDDNSTFEYILIDDEMIPKNAVDIINKIDTNKNKVIIMLNDDKESIKEHYLEDYPFYDYLLKKDLKNEIIRIKSKKN